MNVDPSSGFNEPNPIPVNVYAVTDHVVCTPVFGPQLLSHPATAVKSGIVKS